MKRIINKLNKKKRLIVLCALILTVILPTKFITVNKEVKTKSSSNIFLSSDYTYLPKKAYNYIIKYYEETGIILKTEKNKKNGEAYLNPDFIIYLENNSDSSYVPNITTVDYSYDKVSSDFNSKYDSRNSDGKNYVTSLKNQGSYPLCWDFALTSVLESKLIKEGLATSNVDLSERQIDYATSSSNESVDINRNPYISSSYKLASGGNSSRFLSGVINGISPVLEDSFDTYTTTGKKAPDKVWNIDNAIYTVNGYYQLPSDSNYDTKSGLSSKNFINIVKQEIINNASVGIAISAGSGSYVSYKNDNDDMISNNSIKLYYKDSLNKSSLDHDVAIIGWNDNYTLDVCLSNTGSMSISSNCTGTKKTIQGAWLVKNSYNTYDYVSYDTYGSEYYVINSVSNKNYDNIYTSIMGSYSNNIKDEYNVSVMKYNKLSNTEKLEKIKFKTLESNKEYIINVDGKEVGTINTTYPGIYTLDLSNEDILLKNRSFRIKIKSDNSEYYAQDISVFTSNNDDEISMKFQSIDNYSEENLNGYSEKHLILTDGTSRNLKSSDELVYKVLDSDQNDVTSNFNFYRKHAVSNYIYTIIGFNDIKTDTYSVSVSYNNTEYATFDMYIDLEYISVKTITLNKNELSLNVGKTETLQATIKPDNATNKDVIWTSSDSSVASVDESGKVTALKEGVATITVSSKNDKDKEAKCLVQVTSNTQDIILVNKIVLSESDFEILNNTSKRITAEVFPTNATNKNISWSSSNTSVAKISSDGTITALSKGETTITAQAQDNSGIKTAIKVTVFESVNTTCSISLEDRKVGDVNCDGKVTNTDDALLYNYIRARVKFSSTDTLEIADVDGNGRISISDVAYLHLFDLGRIKKICNSNNKCYSK